MCAIVETTSYVHVWQAVKFQFARFRCRIRDSFSYDNRNAVWKKKNLLKNENKTCVHVRRRCAIAYVRSSVFIATKQSYIHTILSQCEMCLPDKFCKLQAKASWYNIENVSVCVQSGAVYMKFLHYIMAECHRFRFLFALDTCQRYANQLFSLLLLKSTIWLEIDLA